MPTSDFYYVRLKPVDRKRGLVKVRFKAAGQLFIGGDGITQIPIWYRVTPQQAQFLKRYRQSDFDPYSPPAFDIVSPDERSGIDGEEEMDRKAAMGLIPKIIKQKLAQAPESDISGAPPAELQIKDLSQLAYDRSAALVSEEEATATPEIEDAPVPEAPPVPKRSKAKAKAKAKAEEKTEVEAKVADLAAKPIPAPRGDQGELPRIANLKMPETTPKRGRKSTRKKS